MSYYHELLRAASRGCRIQVKTHQGWISLWSVPVFLNSWTGSYRVKPSDLHLDYGPVSKALRLQAEKLSEDLNPIITCGIKIDFPTYDWTHWEDLEELDQSLYFLFMAELLRDEEL